MDYRNEEYINTLVDKYRETNSDKLRDELIDNFKPYFKKYAHLFCGVGPVNLTNKNTITFLRLFMNDKDRSTDERCRRAGEKYVAMIRRIFHDFTKQDIENEVLIFFLEALNKYRPMIADHKRTRERISFTHFIQVNIKFKLSYLCKKKSRDALSGGSIIPYTELFYRAASTRSSKDIDFKWIYGTTTGDIFNSLTNGERYLLWLKYQSDYKGRKLSDKQLERKTGFHHKTIAQKLNRIRDKLREVI